MAQLLRPDADVADGSWTPTGGPTDHYDCIEEATPNDSEYLRDAAANSTCEIGIESGTDPAVSTGHILHVRMRGAGTGGPERVAIALFEGATQRAVSGNFTNRSGSFADKSYTLTTGEADAITDYTNLTIKLIASNMGGGETVDVSQAYFEIPDAGGGGNPWYHNEQQN